MRRNFRHFSSRKRRGVTLVEAAAGTAILGTLLVAVVVAGVRLSAQARASEQRIEACRAADAQLQAWWADPQTLPRESSGEVTGHPGWTWRTQRAPNAAIGALGIEAVALEVLAPGATGRPAARVEVLIPAKQAAEASAPGATAAPPMGPPPSAPPPAPAPATSAPPQTNNAPPAPPGLKP